MPRTTKYKKEWEDMVDLKTGEKLGKWVSEIIGKKDYGRCRTCKKDVKVGTHGINALQSHSRSKYHIKRLETNISVQSKPSTSTGIALAEAVSEGDDNLTLDEQILHAEAIWSTMVAEHDISFMISDHVSKNLSKMFPDSAIAAGFKCCRTKTKYVICEGITLNLHEKLLESVQKVPFSIMIDESNKLYGSKFLCIMIRFFDETIGDVTTRFLDLINCNIGTADAITQCVVDSITKNNLSWDSLMHFMSDSPNVMRGIHKGVFTQIVSKYASHIIDTGGCSLHHVSNTAKNSLPELHMMDELEEFLQDISAFFTFHVEFSEKFAHIQNIFNLENHRILSYSEVRFLSMYPVVERSTEQFPALKKLFLEEIPNKHKNVAKQGRVNRISSALNDKFTLPTLNFILHSLEGFQKYEKLFQRSEPLIHLLYDKQIDLFRTTLIHFCHLRKIEKLKTSDALLSFDYRKPENVLPYNEFSIGKMTKRLISDFSENNKVVFYEGIKRYFIKVCDLLKKNLSLKNKHLANLRFLSPEYRTVEGERMILRCASSMPPNFKLTSREMDALSIEWKLLVLQDIPKDRNGEHIPINVYWKTIFEIKDLGETKFPMIQKVVRFALSISVANGDVERLFSQVSHVISKDRDKLTIETVKGLLITKSYLQTNGTCLNFSLDDSMMNNVRTAHSKYVQNVSKKTDESDKSIQKRILEDSNESLKGNKRLREIKRKKLQIENQEEEIKLKQSKIKMHLEQAHTLMEDSEKMSKFLSTEKIILENAEKQIEEKALKSSCQKFVKEKFRGILHNTHTVDLNNNETDSESN